MRNSRCHCRLKCKNNELVCQAVLGGVCSINFGEIVTIKFLNKLSCMPDY